MRQKVAQATGWLMGALGSLLAGLLRFLREVLSENGTGSLSRTASAALVGAYMYLMVTTRAIPDRTEQLAWLLAALYGANQMKVLGESIALARRPQVQAPPPPPPPPPSWSRP